MISLRVPRLVSVVAAAFLLAGCLDSTEPQPQRVPFELVIISGDGQTAPVGSPIPEPLVLEVVDFVGEPVPGTVIDWSVAIGDLTLAAPASVADAQGRTQNSVLLGQQTGLVAVSARIRGAPGETFFTMIATQ